MNESDIPPLIERFYDRVRRDPEIGPLFDHAVADWPEHLSRLADFWSSVMFTSGRYKGNPMAAHLRHVDHVTPAMFRRWLELWRLTTGEMLSPPAAAAMQAKAARIAKTLQLALAQRRVRTAA